MKRIITILKSLTTAIVALTGLTLFMIAGSFTMLRTGGYESLNAMPLFRWLLETSLENSYWLILSLVCLGVLAINTVLCSVESLLRKTSSRELLLKISPQIIHAGFLLIMVAHLFSSVDSFRSMGVVNEQEGIRLSETSYSLFSDIKAMNDPSGRMIEISSRVTVYDGQDLKVSAIISPNNPAFYNGLGIYLKDARAYPERKVLIEISRDSGAKWALAGGILFFMGNVLLVGLKLKYDSLKQLPDQLLP